MLFLTKKTDRLIVLLSDLSRINADRVNCYQNLAEKLTRHDADLKELFTAIANESKIFEQQLQEKIHLYARHRSNRAKEQGMVYNAWVALNIKLIGTDRDNILSYCEYHEELVQHAYKTATSISFNAMQKEIHVLLLQHQSALKKTYELINRILQKQIYSVSYFAHAN
jgi:uncharacterized protein (TIGR02284 family)